MFAPADRAVLFPPPHYTKTAASPRCLFTMSPMTRPLNLMLLVGEDVGRHLGCYGDLFARTPHLDRLARQGCLFTNAYSTAPVCAPARSSMITGQDPRKIGTHLMRSRLIHPPRLFTHDLRHAGYFVNWTNKTDFNFDPPDDFADATDNWRTALADGRMHDRPWFAFMNFGMTHESRMWPPSSDDKAPLPEPDAGADYLHDLPGLTVPPYLPDTRTTRASLVRYYQHLEAQDAEIGRCLDALEQSGQADRTVVIYLTDHGRGLVREKRWCYDAGVHLPLLVRGPDSIATPGSIRDDPISWVDLAPTFHALAAIDIPDRYDGRVFLGEHIQPEPPLVFFGRDRMDEAHDRVRGAAGRRYHYLLNERPDIPYAQRNRYMETSPVTQQVRNLYAAGELSYPRDLWMAPTKPREELYDKVADPYCVHNLADRPDHAAILTHLRDGTRGWLDRIDDKGRTPERTLVDQGLLRNQIPEYSDRVASLPDGQDDATYHTRYDPDGT